MVGLGEIGSAFQPPAATATAQTISCSGLGLPSIPTHGRLEAGGLEGWKLGWKAARLEGWKPGRLEGWKLGWKARRLEGWKAGGLEGWKAGRLEGWRAWSEGGQWIFKLPI